MIHKGEEIEKAIAAVEAKLIYLPTYSPDFNPIEEAEPELEIETHSGQSQPQPHSNKKFPIAGIEGLLYHFEYTLNRMKNMSDILNIRRLAQGNSNFQD